MCCAGDVCVVLAAEPFAFVAGTSVGWSVGWSAVVNSRCACARGKEKLIHTVCHNSCWLGLLVPCSEYSSVLDFVSLVVICKVVKRKG